MDIGALNYAFDYAIGARGGHSNGYLEVG